MKKFLEKNKKIVLAISIIILLSILALSFIYILKYVTSKNKVNEISKDNYELQYDDTWKMINATDVEVNLLHKKSKSEVNIKINELQDENQYKTIEEIFDSILYNIQEQNKDYKLIYKETAKITKQNINGYKLLFETNDRQATVYFYKQGNKLVVFTYEATYDYFDILIDSFNNIIYNFNIKESQFNIETSINLDIKKINYTEQEEIVNLLKETKEEEITTSNYLVQYTIPDNFKSTSYDSRYGYYYFTDISNESSIKLNVSIMERNIYEYLDRESTPNVYDKYQLNSYNREKEEIDKFSDKPLSYIYKNSYLSNNEINENIVVIYELNKNHIFIVEINSQGIGIPEELVKSIKIKGFKNVASNINIVKENGFLIGKLRQYTDYTYEKTQEVILKLPENYQEIDENANLYEKRIYISEYNDEMKIPKYKVIYEITQMNIDNKLEMLSTEINQQLGEYKNFKQLNDITANNKIFKVYERGYTQLHDETYTKYYTNEKILFYELSNDRYLVIRIDGNENKISDELINQLTNVDVNVK